MADPIRAALERLVKASELVIPMSHYHAFEFADAIAAGKAALAKPDGLAVPESRETASVIEEPSDIEQVAQQVFEAMRFSGATSPAPPEWVSGGNSLMQDHARDVARALLVRWGHQPAPPAEGEVAELVEWLHDCADVRMDEGYEEPAFKFARAAELFQQQEAEIKRLRAQQTPVPVEAANPWKDALIDALVCAFLLNEENQSDPRLALHDLISWEVQLARDPLINPPVHLTPVPVGMIPVEYWDIDSGARIVSEPSEEGPGGCWVVLNSRHINPLTEFPTAKAAWDALQQAHALPLPQGEVEE